MRSRSAAIAGVDPMSGAAASRRGRTAALADERAQLCRLPHHLEIPFTQAVGAVEGRLQQPAIAPRRP